MSADEDQGGVAVETPEAPARPAPPSPKREQKVDPRSKPKLLPPHAVILHNDPYNGFPFVIETLQRVFKYSFTKSFKLTLQAHLSGRSLIWSGSKEVAELKAEQVLGRGADPQASADKARPLRVTVEPMPG